MLAAIQLLSGVAQAFVYCPARVDVTVDGVDIDSGTRHVVAGNPTIPLHFEIERTASQPQQQGFNCRYDIYVWSINFDGTSGPVADQAPQGWGIQPGDPGYVTPTASVGPLSYPNDGFANIGITLDLAIGATRDATPGTVFFRVVSRVDGAFPGIDRWNSGEHEFDIYTVPTHDENRSVGFGLTPDERTQGGWGSNGTPTGDLCGGNPMSRVEVSRKIYDQTYAYSLPHDVSFEGRYLEEIDRGMTNSCEVLVELTRIDNILNGLDETSGLNEWTTYCSVLKRDLTFKSSGSSNGFKYGRGAKHPDSSALPPSQQPAAANWYNDAPSPVSRFDLFGLSGSCVWAIGKLLAHRHDQGFNPTSCSFRIGQALEISMDYNQATSSVSNWHEYTENDMEQVFSLEENYTFINNPSPTWQWVKNVRIESRRGPPGNQSSSLTLMRLGDLHDDCVLDKH